MNKKKIKQGFSIHLHHDILAEYCWDYDERVDFIKKNKPKNEIELRLKLFKILPPEARKEIPDRHQKACVEYQKACAEHQRACANWPQESKDAFHKKWCGCKNWNGKGIIFTK